MANKPRELPILFQSDMVRAVLDGRKHLTSRVIKPQPFFCRGEYWSVSKKVAGYKGQAFPDFCKELAALARYQVGDRLWVRESWAAPPYYNNTKPSDIPPGTPILHGASENTTHSKKRPSIFLPRWASRINLEVTAVFAKRIQQISEDDALDEGIDLDTPATILVSPYATGSAAVDMFAQLWDSINSAPKFVKSRNGLDHYVSYPWDYQDNVAQISKHRGKTHIIYGNPFVFVYKFKRLGGNNGN